MSSGAIILAVFIVVCVVVLWRHAAVNHLQWTHSPGISGVWPRPPVAGTWLAWHPNGRTMAVVTDRGEAHYWPTDGACEAIRLEGKPAELRAQIERLHFDKGTS